MSDPAAQTPREATYAPGVVARLVGISEHVLRAWEKRYGAVQPLRTAGGTRRYRPSDVDRLRKLHAATRAGHSIGRIAGYSDAELDAVLANAPPDEPELPLEAVLDALERLDGSEAERRLGALLAALGGTRFIRKVAAPMLEEVGRRWEAGKLGIASEHLASAVVRSLLGSLLRPTAASLGTPPILFTTPPGETHELGALMAAVATVEVGGHPVFLGGNLPIPDVVEAVDALGAGAVGLSLCFAPRAAAEAAIVELREALPESVGLWIGGRASGTVTLPPGAARIADDAELERRVRLLAQRPASAPS